ncbi:MAG: FeS assembly system protein [Adhaeribacter sp.]|jgi:metal-sulfur cluster biosynthetic enzyme|nr:FeS assembly system protein [Adhaeribacter sp.]
MRIMAAEANFGEHIYELLKQVIDPEIGLNIVDLGLVYQVSLSDDKTINISMTLTTPGCPMGQVITGSVTNVLQKHYPDYEIKVELVWIPMWDSDMISEAGQAQLNGGYQPQHRDHGQSLWDRFF